MLDIAQDFRFALRGLRKRPTFTAAALLTLTVGIGATTTLFSVVDGVVLQPLPFPQADRLVTLCERYPGASDGWCSVSPPNVEDIASRARSIEAIGIGRTWSYHLATPEGKREVSAAIVTPGTLTALRVRPLLGRPFLQDDVIGGPSTTAILSHEMWQSRFSGDSSIVGRAILLDDLSVTIVGVMPPGVALPQFRPVDLWRPVHILTTEERHRDWRGFVAFGRLRDAVTIETARAEIAHIADDIEQAHFATTPGWGITVRPLHDIVVGRVRPTMLALLGAAGVVLLISCVNVANLLLVRGNARAREMALRAALGAGRRRIVRVIGTESVVLALAGSVLGVAVAMVGVHVFKALAPAGIPRVQSVEVDLAVVGFAVLASLVSAVIFGTLPAVRAAHADVFQALREGGRGASRSSGRVGAVLVAVELALAVALVSGGGLLLRTFAAYADWRPGFDHGSLLMFNLFAPQPQYTSERTGQLWSTIESELRTLPGVSRVATASAGPLFGGDGSATIALEGRETPAGASVEWFDIGPGWFETLGVPIVAGRDFDATDRAEGVRVAIVNETFVNRYLPNDPAAGRRFTMLDRGLTLEIIGVVRDVPPLHPNQPPAAQVYWSNRQLPRPFTWVLVRTTGEPGSVLRAVHARLANVDRDLAPGSPQTYGELLARQLKRPRFTMSVVLGFGLTALLLAAIGVYGLMSYVSALRQRELAIRLALGAQRQQVMGTMLRWSARIAVVGATCGSALALIATRGIRALLAGVSPTDPTTLVTSTIVVLVVAVGAALAPAWRASRADPAIVLSSE